MWGPTTSKSSYSPMWNGKKVMTSPITNAKVSASALNMVDHSSAMQSLRKKKIFALFGQLTMLGLIDGQDA